MKIKKDVWKKHFCFNNKGKRFLALVMPFMIGIGLCGCGSKSDSPKVENQGGQNTGTSSGISGANVSVAEHDTNISAKLTYDHSMELSHARDFSVDYYNDGYALITIERDGQYLVVPEGLSAPEDLSEDITILQQPLNQIYLVASAVMDMYISMGALDQIRFSALESGSWYLDPAREKMEAGDIIYAGKYSAPDYERILTEGCDLAIENTMIYHNPEVKEELQKLGIPVLVDYSSYENDPVGRVEWVKLYGLLAGKEEEANAAYERQAALFEEAGASLEKEKTVAFFYITSNGAVNVRKSTDYLPRMIELAGGTYIFSELGADSENASSTVSMQMEEFYAAAKDADYLIYNSTIEAQINSMSDLLALSPLMEKFKAVQENRVYCTTKNLYQASMELGTITEDIHRMLTGEQGMTYLYQVSE